MSAPLFSRYLFVNAGNDIGALYDARRAKGVSSFAGRSVNQSLLPDSVIQAIRSRVDHSGVVCVDTALLKAGQPIKIIDGPFAGLEAIFQEPDSQKRSYILLDLLGKSNRIKLSNQSFST